MCREIRMKIFFVCIFLYFETCTGAFFKIGNITFFKHGKVSIIDNGTITVENETITVDTVNNVTDNEIDNQVVVIDDKPSESSSESINSPMDVGHQNLKLLLEDHSSSECVCKKKFKIASHEIETTTKTTTDKDPCAHVCVDLSKDDVEPICMMSSRYKKGYQWFMNQCHARRAICLENLDIHLVHPSRCMKTLQFFMPIV